VIDSICGREVNFVTTFGKPDNLTTLTETIAALKLFVIESVRLGLSKQQVISLAIIFVN